MASRLAKGIILMTPARIFSANHGCDVGKGGWRLPSTAASSGCKIVITRRGREFRSPRFVEESHPHRHGTALEAHGRRPRWDYRPPLPAPCQCQLVTQLERS